MTRKDYVAMAEDIRHAHERWTDTAEQEIAKQVLRAFLTNFKEYLKEDNANFNETKFLQACGFEVL